MVKYIRSNILFFIFGTVIAIILSGCEKDMVEPENNLNLSIYTIEIYPNPSTGIFYLDSTIIVKKSALFNIMGRRINGEFQNNSLDLSNYPAGIYLLQVTDENGNVSVSKLIKTQKDNSNNK